jgi:hypothetical protein
MKYKYNKVLLVIFFAIFFTLKIFSLEIPKNDFRFFLATTNDKFSYGISENKDDQLTASNEIHIIFPYLFLDINLNGITNRGFKTDLLDFSTFESGRYDEIIAKTGTTLNLLKISDFEIDFVPEIGFCLLGNFGMEFEQNLNHKSGTIDAVNLDYETFEKPFVPLANAKFVFSYNPIDFIKTQISFSSNNIFSYSTEQNFVLNAVFGKKSIFNIFAGYTWNQNQNSSSTLKSYKDVTNGFNYGFNLDTGLVKFDFINYAKTKYGLGAINVDFMNFSKHNWQKSDVHFLTGLTYFMNTEFLENQIQVDFVHNFSFYFNNKFVSGFKSNKINPSEYRYERDYVINTFGVKYEQPLVFIKNWITPYIELGTGTAYFKVQKLANHIPTSTYDSYEYDSKVFWQMEANIGLDIIPEGKLNFGNSSYQVTVFVGTTFIPDYENATKQIQKDTYRAENWSLKPFEFRYGFAVHFGLDF